MPDAKQAEVQNKLEALYAGFEAKMEELRKKRFDWMNQVVSRIEQEQIAAIKASITK